MTNIVQEYEMSAVYTNEVKPSEQETTQYFECENVCIKENTERPEDIEVCLVTKHIANADQFEKYSIASTYDISGENIPDILVNQLHKTIAEMKKCKGEGFNREYSVSRHLVKMQNKNK